MLDLALCVVVQGCDMPCYSPLKGWRSQAVNDSGKRGIVFNVKAGFADMPIDVPCGQCIGCRLEKSRQWALRCVHEASLYPSNVFITLTYSDEHLPKNASLDKAHFQKFMKRLRKKYHGNTVRFYHCGEYGDVDNDNPKHLMQYGVSKLGRPHYHALLFNIDFADKQIISDKDGIRLYTSQSLSRLWPYGYNTIGEVTFESAAYCARYVTKKMYGEKADEHYTRVFPSTGEIVNIEPEYTTMSRRPGIGKDWFKQYRDDVYPKDFVTVRGKKIKPPVFYDRMLEVEDPEYMEKIKMRRKRDALKRSDDNTGLRLLEKEQVKKAQIGFLKRPLEDK